MAVAVETPYLQLVMTRLWRHDIGSRSRILRAASLKDLGGAAAIVNGHLTEVLAALAEPELESCARMFPYLVTPSGTKIAHTAADLARFAKIDRGSIVPLLEKLASGEWRILTPVAPPDSAPSELKYEIYHDSLAQAILAWQAEYDKLREQAVQRAETERKQRHVRQLSVALAIAVVAMIASLVSAWFALEQKNAAERAGAEEKKARAQAAASRNEALAATLTIQALEARREGDRQSYEKLLAEAAAAVEEANRLRASKSSPRSPDVPQPVGKSSSYPDSSIKDKMSMAMTPKLALKGIGSYEVGGKTFTRYDLTILNWDIFSADLFRAAPNLPPCGSNTNSSRTWVHIHDASNRRYIYGFCALPSPQSLTNIWFGVEKDKKPLTVYVRLLDRLEGVAYQSNNLDVR
jgi:hypothetical protein